MPITQDEQRRGGDSPAQEKSQTTTRPSTKPVSGLPVSAVDPAGKKDDDGDDINKPPSDMKDEVENDAPRRRRPAMGGSVKTGGVSRRGGNGNTTDINVKIIGIDTSQASLSKATITNLDFPM